MDLVYLLSIVVFGVAMLGFAALCTVVEKKP